MRLVGILTVASITASAFMQALSNPIEAQPDTSAIEPLTMSPRQSTIPGLLVWSRGMGRRQITGDCCAGGKLHTTS